MKYAIFGPPKRLILDLKWNFSGIYWFKLDETWYLGSFEHVFRESAKKNEKKVKKMSNFTKKVNFSQKRP